MNEIFNQFKELFYEDLNKTIHPNGSYHKEGSVWTHTMLVFNEAYKNSNNIVMHISALLHDIGKKEAELQKEDGKIVFQGHEGISTLKSINFLKNLLKEKLLTETQLLEILYIINYHGSLWKKSEKQIKKYFNQKLYNQIYQFSLYDQGGNLTFDINRNNKPKLENLNNNNNNISIDLNKPNCYIMIGIPTSGKSTYIKNNFKNLEILSRDNILMEYSKKKYKCSTCNGRGIIDAYYGDLKTSELCPTCSDYNILWEQLSEEDHKEIDKLLLKKFTKLKQTKKDFVIDMTNTSWKSRRRWITQLKGFNIIAKIFLIDLEDIYKRNEKRKKEENKFIKKEVLISMSKKLELPLYNEGINEIEYIFDNFSINLNNKNKLNNYLKTNLKLNLK